MAIDAEEPDRRDFLTLTAGAFVAVGGAISLWPFIDQMNIDAGAQSLTSIEVDVAPIAVGQAITVLWRNKPVFIRHRTKEEIEKALAVDLKDLPDDIARNEGLPSSELATDENRTKPGHENWLVMIGICTPLGCIPKGQKLGDKRGDFDGWFCPCHGSHYAIRPDAFVRALPRAISTCPSTSSSLTQRSRSAEERKAHCWPEPCGIGSW